MMRRLSNPPNILIATYDAGDGFTVEIYESDILFDAWLGHRDYGVKTHMFGFNKSAVCGNIETFVDVVEGNIEQYTDSYMRQYADF